MTSKSKFILGFTVAMIVAGVANVGPYFLTKNAYQHDGQQVAGFPFAFHRIGGDCAPDVCDTFNFNIGYFSVDLIIALVCGMAIGLIAARFGERAGKFTR